MIRQDRTGQAGCQVFTQREQEGKWN